MAYAYAAAPAATPAPATAEPFEEGKAPPVIDSHGGKLTPVTGIGPDGPTSFLLLLALLATVAPRGLKAFGQTIDLSAIRLAPGLVLAAVIAWNHLPGLGTDPEFPAKFHTLMLVSGLLGAALFLITFLHLLSDALMPLQGRSMLRSVVAMAASGLGVLALPVAGGLDLNELMNMGGPQFDPTVIIAGYLGVPAGAGLLLLWRRLDGRLFDVLLVGAALGSFFLVGSFIPGAMTGFMWLQLVAFTVAATLGAGLRGLGLAGWQGLTGRAAWIWAWVLRICLFTALTVTTSF